MLITGVINVKLLGTAEQLYILKIHSLILTFFFFFLLSLFPIIYNSPLCHNIAKPTESPVIYTDHAEYLDYVLRSWGFERCSKLVE
jgi:hypothetical protein